MRMKIYKTKRHLTYAPFIGLTILSLFFAKIYFLNINDKHFIIPAVLSLIVALLFLSMSYIKICTTDEYISRPYLVNPKQVKWVDIFEVKSVKSSISGYSSVTISYYLYENEEQYERQFFVIGSWFNGYSEIVSALEERAINAKFV